MIRLGERLGAASGLAFGAATLASALIGDVYDAEINPNPGTPAGELARVFERHSDDLGVAAYLTLLGAFFALAFGAWLRDVLARSRAPAWLPNLAFGGLVAIATLLLLEAAFVLAARETVAYGDAPQLAKTWYVLSWNYANVFAAPALAVVSATTLATLGTAIIPRWLTWLSAAITAVIVVLIIANMPGAAIVMFVLWTVIASLTLLARPAAAA